MPPSNKPAPGKATAQPLKLPSGTQASNTKAAALVQAAVLLGLLGIFSNASLLALSPVYGGIPASKWHSYVLIAGCFLGWAGNVFLRQSLPVRTASLLPLVALHIPTVQYFIFEWSEKLGCEWGPVVTEAVTLLPLAVLSASSVADAFEGLELSVLPGFVADAVPGMASWGTIKLVEHVSQYHIGAHVGQGLLYTRMGMELLLAGSYAVLAPSKLLLLAVPALLHSAMLNTHIMTEQATLALNNTMGAQNWTLIDRKESLTGYLSVIESNERGFRVMRCDHSLLGGEWVMIQGQKASEPIYGVFVMLEAVRLIETKPVVADADASALVM